MSWKNPRCPNCKGKTKKDSDGDLGKWWYKCKNCGHRFEHWGHFKNKK